MCEGLTRRTTPLSIGVGCSTGAVAAVSSRGRNFARYHQRTAEQEIAACPRSEGSALLPPLFNQGDAHSLRESRAEIRHVTSLPPERLVHPARGAIPSSTPVVVVAMTCSNTRLLK